MRSLAFFLALAGCYDLPKPECGFVCGADGSCPSDYTCNSADNRCHLAGAEQVTCPSGFDAGPGEPPDRTAPEVTAFTPLSDAVDVLPSARITVTFSERIVGASPVTIRLERAGASVATDVEFDLATNTATVTPLTPLAREAFYSVTVIPDLIDLAGNPLAGPTRWSFRTSTPPNVTQRSPAPGTLGVGVDATAVAEFDEMIFGVTSVSFSLQRGVLPVAGSHSITNANQRVTFTPAAQLWADTDYTVVITTAITDAVGNSLVGAPVSWTFTTGADTVAPSIVAMTPAVGRTSHPVSASVSVTFDEPVGVDVDNFTLSQNGTPVPATLVISNGGRTARLDPDADLAPDTTYLVTLTSAVTDGAGNPLPPTSWSFTTESP